MVADTKAGVVKGAPSDYEFRVEVDRSSKQVIVLYWAAALFWLTVASIAGIISSIKLHNPGFLGGIEWLTFGRVRAVHWDTAIYGFGGVAASGTLLWLQARLCQVRMPYTKLLIAGGLVFNVGILVGVVGILMGQSTGVETLEFPLYAMPFLVVPYVFIVIANFTMYFKKKSSHTYVSQWYLMAVTVWFPVLVLSAEACTNLGAVDGVAQAIANWWYGHNVVGLFATPTGIAAAYYLIPKVIGKPIHSYHLSLLGFWSNAIFYNWAGTHHLTGGPLPAWTITLGVVGSMMMFIPVITIGINHHMTMLGSFHLLKTSPTLRFAVMGSMLYTVSSFQGALEALRSHQEITHFTHYTIGHVHLGMYGFFAPLMFAMMYYAMPRLMNREWSSARLIRIHFWCTLVGTLLYGGAMCYAGIRQGMMMNDPSIPFLNIVQWTIPFLMSRTLAGLILLSGTVAFLINFVRIVTPHKLTWATPTMLDSDRDWKQILEAEKEAKPQHE
ncbi:MAG: cbb3-type cytochrome c oxidase subunit I [Acidobacteria bacterium]|nr:cbb3-type cytochrome c oxidase subunit I [Acidobacteriota bacterium]